MGQYDYEVISSCSLTSLTAAINEALANGAKLSGGIAVIDYEASSEFYQSIYRERAWKQQP